MFSWMSLLALSKCLLATRPKNRKTMPVVAPANVRFVSDADVMAKTVSCQSALSLIVYECPPFKMSEILS